jgi:prepilin-type N-terminal cleavage/methylation domain-containing protein
MKPYFKRSIAGFTLVEMLVVIVIVGILAAIAAPTWQGWLIRQRVNTAQSEALNTLRQAQANAKREKRMWQACFRDDGTRVIYTVTAAVNCNTVPLAAWIGLAGEDANVVAIDTANTNLRSDAGNYYVQYQYKGLLVETLPPQTGNKITFGIRDRQGSPGVSIGTRRCISVQTLLGALSLGSDQECTQ